jgi:membrane protein involved in D-alanine export
MYGYSLYLYFDFAGYSAFAVGVSYLLGIHTPENFSRPFLAGNIKDFWNRWHISLSTWLRDHVYMRFMLAAAKGRWFTGKYTASYLGYFLTFGLMGLWHGIEPCYLLYGLYHGTLLVGHDLFTRWNKPRRVWGNEPLWRATGTLVTFHMVCLGFLLFSGRIGPTWEPASSVPPVTQGVAPALVVLHESSDGQTIRGRARDASRPDLPVKVAILDGNRLLAGVLADGFRADIKQAGRGNGRRGFSYSIPAELKDGGKHLILVKLAGTDIDLQNMPRSITLSPTFSGGN